MQRIRSWEFVCLFVCFQVNKEEAERSKQIGAQALRSGDLHRSRKMFQKSLRLYPLPGVEALLSQVERMIAASSGNNSNATSNGSGSTAANNNNNNNGRSSNYSNSSRSSSSNSNMKSNTNSNGSAPAASSSTTSSNGNGRPHTAQQEKIVRDILAIKQSGGRKMHYKILGVSESANENGAFVYLFNFILLAPSHPFSNSLCNNMQ